MGVEAKTYRPSDLAKMFSIHTNTVRLYEKQGFISKATRTDKGYRKYSKKHILQLQIVRYIFAYPFTNHQIRAQGIIRMMEQLKYVDCPLDIEFVL